MCIIAVGILCLVTTLNLQTTSSEHNEIKIETSIVEEEVVTYNGITEEKPLLGTNKGELPDGVPEEIRQAADIVGLEYGISPEFLMAVAWKESRYIPTVIGAGKYYGLMQIHPGSHHKRMQRLGINSNAELLNVYNNIRVGADYLAELRGTEGDLIIALIYYHGEGDRAAMNYALHGTTSAYVRDVLAKMEELQIAHKKIYLTED